jgi:hypothetical protein
MQIYAYVNIYIYLHKYIYIYIIYKYIDMYTCIHLMSPFQFFNSRFIAPQMRSQSLQIIDQRILFLLILMKIYLYSRIFKQSLHRHCVFKVIRSKKVCVFQSLKLFAPSLRLTTLRIWSGKWARRFTCTTRLWCIRWKSLSFLNLSQVDCAL